MVGFLLIGFGSAPVFIPGLVALAKNIKIIDPSIDELTANDISSAINNLTIDVGEFIGPIAGGFLTSRYNFKYCCFIVFLIGIVYSGLFILYFIRNIKDDIIKFMINKQSIEETEKKNSNKNLLDEDDSIFDEISINSVQINHSFLGSFKLDSISRRRNTYANKFRRSNILSKSSLHSALTS